MHTLTDSPVSSSATLDWSCPTQSTTGLGQTSIDAEAPTPKATYWLSAASGFIAVPIVTYVCFQFHLNLTITSFLYLIIVVLQSLRGRLASSVLISLLTVACLDFFFTEPIFSFEVTDPLDILALISFLTTGIVITRLTTRARKEAEISNRQRRQVDLLYDLARGLLALDPEKDVLGDAAEKFREVFQLKAVCLFDGFSGQFFTAGMPVANLRERTQSVCVLGLEVNDAASATYARSLHASGRNIGAVAFQGLNGYELTIGPLAALASAMLERARGFQTASRAAAAAQAEVFRGAVLDALAHEFKTPLATILTAAGGIQTRPLLPQQRELAELIECETARLSGLTSQALHTARLESSDIKPCLRRTDLTALVSKCVNRCSRSSVDRRFRIKQTVPADVLADRELLELVFQQLLDNAGKYSCPGTDIDVSIECSEGRAAVRVSNAGKPIFESERERIFERFYRGAATADTAPGSGLGLYFAQEIARAHGGTMELETPEPPERTTFCLTLPLTQSEC